MDPLPETIRIRVSAEDKRMFEAQAQRASMSLSAWARMKLKEAAISASTTDRQAVRGDAPNHRHARPYDRIGETQVSFTVEVQTPLHGAAYQILFQRVSPAFCVTRERKAEIEIEFHDIIAWSRTQPDDVWTAYKWAANQILADIERALVRNELGSAVQKALTTLPKPPQKEPA